MRTVDFICRIGFRQGWGLGDLGEILGLGILELGTEKGLMRNVDSRVFRK